MTKTIMILAIAAAFVVGMIVSTTPVFAPGIGEGDELVAEAIDALTVEVASISSVAGPEGPEGPEGLAVGLKTYTELASDITTSSIAFAIIQCDAGDIATGGTALVNGGQIDIDCPVTSDGDCIAPGEVATGWKVIADNDIPNVSFSANAYVICADIAEPFR